MKKPKVSKYVSTIWLRKDQLQGPHWGLGMGDCYVTTMKPMAIHGLPRTRGTWVEFRAVRTFTTKLKRKGKK